MHYQKIGEIIILSRKDKEAAERLLLLPNTKTVLYKSGSIFGKYREPQLKKLAGNGTETIHKEHGCLFRLDVEKIMWSKGNHNERTRLIEMVKKGEVIVDMFAGIGYFSIPLAVHSRAKKIYAIEINPVSFLYLKENVKLNKTRKIETINSDCKEVEIKQKADRVLMGLLPSAKKYLPKALEFVKNGGMIHYHGLDRDEPENLMKEVEEVCRKKKVKCEFAGKSRVKSWNPKKWHWVLDVRIKKGVREN